MKDNGGAAFPCERERGERLDSSEGMTLRDYFAAKALQGIFASGNLTTETEQKIAVDAYLMADAMLAERAK